MTQPATLICLPPAGAGPSLFRDWQRADPGILAPSLPGREARFREPCPPSLPALAELLAAELAPTLPGRYGIFGYSMGGTLAVLLAHRLMARGLAAPAALFTLGALAPDQLNGGVGRLHRLDSAAFWDEIARIGGTPAEILESADLRSLFEPMLRQDFALCEGYRHDPALPPLPCPIHVILADEDHLVGPESLADWHRVTAADALLHQVAGPHMLPPTAFAALRSRLRSL